MYNFKISKRVVQEKNQTPKNYTNININFKKFIFIDQCFSILTPPFRALYLYFITNSSFIHDSQIKIDFQDKQALILVFILQIQSIENHCKACTFLEINTNILLQININKSICCYQIQRILARNQVFSSTKIPPNNIYMESQEKHNCPLRYNVSFYNII